MTNDTSPPEPELYGRAAEVHREMQSFADKTGVLGDTDYHPMTANEAGGSVNFETFGLKPSNVREPDLAAPSKPCTDSRHPRGCACEFVVASYDEMHPPKPCPEGGDHCFCVFAYTSPLHFEGDSIGNQCCWCEEREILRYVKQRVPGHGKYRTDLVRE